MCNDPQPSDVSDHFDVVRKKMDEVIHLIENNETIPFDPLQEAYNVANDNLCAGMEEANSISKQRREEREN